MADPEIDDGFFFDEQGRIDILHSPFFDVHFSHDDVTANAYIDRILYQLVLVLEEHICPDRWEIIGRLPFPPTSVTSPSTRILRTSFLVGIPMNIQETVRKQIVQEIKINQASQCPHVVVCRHSFYHNGIISLVLEYMDRGSLADIIRQVNTILEPYLAVLCKHVLKGLVYLHHERRVIHRDIKPSNLLVNHKGEVKITDFGVSAVLGSSMGQRDTFVGTYNYMAPERISGGSYDFKSDIWSLGLVILECAIGCFPYRHIENDEGPLSFYELLESIVEEPPPSAPSDQFSPEFCSFISSCIQKDPHHRMSSLELLSHPFIKKFEDKDINLGILVSSLDPPVNLVD